MPIRTLATRRVAALTVTTLLAASLGACGTATPGGNAGTPPTAGAASPSTSTSSAAAAVVLDDGWAKAAPAGAMTAVFGTLRNTSARPVTVTGGASPVAARVELHETVRNDAGAMQMQPKQGGLTIPAGGTHLLEPGGDHLMLLGLTASLENGTTTAVTLSTSDGEVVLTVPVRSFAGAEESYVPSPTHS